MPKIPEHIIKEINEKANLLEVVNKFVPMSNRGANRTGDCPKCGGKKKLTVTPAKGIFKCFASGCDVKGNSALGFLMNTQNMDFLTAVKWLADWTKVFIEDEVSVKLPEPKKNTAQRKAPKTTVKSFRDEQLRASGLTEDDQKCTVRTGPDTQTIINRYTSGTLNERYEIVDGDDMVMRYVSLSGELVTYVQKNSKKEREFFRMRWQYPEQHKDKDGKPIKYQSPAGSGSKLWFPSKFLDMYSSGASFETLAIHEGEKKADKAMKHGLPSIGIMGIHNLVVNERLPHEIDQIVKRGVKNVLFVVDADFRDLSSNTERSADQRPRSFMKAVWNFHQHFFAYNNYGLNINIYMAYVRDEHGVKGFDDLLAGPAAGKEDEVIRNMYATMKLPTGEGQWLDCKNITAWSYSQLQKFFHVDNVESFSNFYKKELTKREVFKYGKELWRINKKGEIELAQPLGDNEKFWEEKQITRGDRQGEEIIRFNYARCYNFLLRRGYGRYKTFEGSNIYVRIENNQVLPVNREEVKTYITEFTEQQLNKENLLNLLFAGSSRYFSDESLSNLKFVQLNLLESQKGVQFMFFANQYWRISAEKIESGSINDLPGHVWKEEISDRHANLLPSFLEVSYTPSPKEKDLDPQLWDYSAGEFDITKFSPDADRCHFLLFLFRTSNFWPNKDRRVPAQLDQHQRSEMIRNALQKMTALGYLLHTHFDSRVTKAVIAMDAKLSEVGASEGRSGKSLIGRALQRLLPTVYIPGKQKDLTEDRFLLEEVKPGRTKILWIDDVRVNFDFEFFFPFITGGAKFETKGLRRTTLPPEHTPKLYICTNHAINESGGSFSSRMIKLAFSDYYYDNGNGDSFSPLDDFGISFFDEWDQDEWNRFYNLAATCLQLYFKYGIIYANNERLEMRRIRQFVGEIFLDYCDSYFANRNNLNHDIPRQEFTDAFYEKHPDQRRIVDVRRVKQKLAAWCKFRKYVFNPGRPNKGDQHGGDIKKGGVEYFFIADEQYIKDGNWINAAEMDKAHNQVTQSEMF